MQGQVKIARFSQTCDFYACALKQKLFNVGECPRIGVNPFHLLLVSVLQITMAEMAKKVNWNAEERDVLVEECQNSSIATGKFSQLLSAADKARFWTNVTESINSIGQTKRTTAQVKKKWIDLKSETKKKTIAHSHELKKTGGGPVPVISMEPWESKVLQTIPSCSIECIPGGCDTFLERSMPTLPSVPSLPISTLTGCDESCDPSTPSEPGNSEVIDSTGASEEGPPTKKGRYDKRGETNAKLLIHKLPNY